jgi:glycosyltransferase involved in cell wall biosynthesis
MRILIATDAWRPQVNGVVSTLERMTQAAAEFGAEFEFLTPQGMWSAPLPSYPEIRLALPSLWRIDRQIEEAAPDHIHIATEGPIGWLTRCYCLRRKRVFTTSYHTRFPEYVSARFGVPEWLTYAGLHYFHAPSAAVMAPTPTIAADLTRRGFTRVRLWTRGVNHALYRPRTERTLDLPRPIFLSVGRVAVEKNLEALLRLDLPGSTVIVGDGPERRRLERRYRHAHFLGAKHGEALADIYASADVFVFPSRTDTFGIVLIEALASGLPVAAFPVPGPIDVVAPGAGVLDEDLRAACLKALAIPRERARESSLRFTWKESARQFLDNIEASRLPRRQTAPSPEAVAVARVAERG